MNYRERVEVWFGEEMLGTAVFVGTAEKKGVLWAWSGQLTQLDFGPSKLTVGQYQLKFDNGETREVEVVQHITRQKVFGGQRLSSEVVRVTGRGKPPNV